MSVKKILLLVLESNKCFDFINNCRPSTFEMSHYSQTQKYTHTKHDLSYSDVLINQTRSKIIDFLEYRGRLGAHFREIQATVKTGVGILKWHLGVLQDFGIVHLFKVNRYNVFVVNEFKDEFNFKEKQLEIKFRSKYSETILEKLLHIKRGDLLKLTQLSKLCLVDRKIVKNHLTILMEEKILILDKKSCRIERIDINKIRYLLKIIRNKENYIHKSRFSDVTVS